MIARIISHEELDRKLDQLAENPATFEQEAGRLAKQLDEAGLDLEIADPMGWRRSSETRGGARVSISNQFRYEVESIESLDRETEARLARRIEFARIRLTQAMLEAGLDPAELQGNASFTPSAFVDPKNGPDGVESGLPAKVGRHWMELHAMRTEMVERNLYLALINVERYAHTTAGRMDLIQEGSAALFRAVDGFDWRRGLLFRTYAVHWLNQAFRSHLYNFGNTVRVPVYLQKALKHINLARQRLADRQASPEQIADEANLAENLVRSAITAARSTHSIDMPMGEDDSRSALRDVLDGDVDYDPYSTELEDVSLERGISEAMDRLSEREQFVVRMRFGIGEEREHTLAEVARELGVSLERVRQIQVRAVSKMNTPTLRKAVDPFLN